MTESQLKQVIEFAHQAGQRNAGIDASTKAARDYYQSLVQDGGLSFVSERQCMSCEKQMKKGEAIILCKECTE